MKKMKEKIFMSSERLFVALKAKLWYSEDVSKNPIYLFDLLHLNISFIDQPHHMPEAK